MCKGCIPRYPFCVRKDKRGGSGIGGRAFRPWHRSGVLRSLRIHYSSEQVLIRLVGSPKPVWEVLLIWNILWSNWSFGLACYVVFVQSLSHIQLFMIPRTAARQASSSFTISWSFLKLMSIESVMPSKSHPLSSPSPPAFSLSQHQGLFQWVSSLPQVAKVLDLQLQPFQWIFRVDFLWIGWFELPEVLGTLKSLI